jgi:hypothetical protein
VRYERAAATGTPSGAGAPNASSASIQNDSGLPQGPAGPSPGRLLMRQTACAPAVPRGMIDGGTVGGSPMFGIRRREFVTLLGGAAAARGARAAASKRRNHCSPKITSTFSTVSTHLRHWRLQISAFQTDHCRPSRRSQNSVLVARVEVQKYTPDRFPHRRLDRQIEKMIQRLFTKATR